MKLYKLLSTTTIERQVEDVYNHALERAFSGLKLEYPFACDGYCEFEVDGKTHRLLIEYKYDEDMQSNVAKAKVLAQVLFYLKRFEKNGRPLPNVCMVADKNECFVMHTNALLKHLDFENVDWDKAPSGAGGNGDLVLALSEDKDINPFVFDVDAGFDFDVVVQKLKDLASGTVRLVRVTEHNVDKIFKMFSEKIVLDKKYPPNDMVALFFNIVTGSDDVYLHPTKKNILVVNGKNVRVDSSKFNAFCGHFSTTCSPKEKARLAAISDRLIEDTNRRRKGEFYTPTAFVDYSHNMVTKRFGENWRDEYVVWDCAWGTGNLTRDYKFKELYASTLEQAELDIAKNHNPEATKFQFDFLNDELKRVSEGGKVPDSLMDALEQNKKIIFYINPPYKTVSYTNSGSDGIAKNTLVNTMMTKDNVGRAKQEVYAQFLYRIFAIQNSFGLQNCCIALFCNPKFLCGGAFDKFRNKFLNAFKFEDGIFFNASHFGKDVSAAWGITFNIWSTGKTIDKSNFTHSIVDLVDGDIAIVGSKILYNLDDDPQYLGKLIQKQKRTVESVVMKYPNPLQLDEANIKTLPNGIGSIFFGTNAYCGSTLLYYHGHDIIITPDNIDDVAVIYATINNHSSSWINEKDEFKVPNKSQPNYSQYVNDCLIYLTFGMYDFSLRQVSYHNKLWDIKNNFFWCNPKDIAEWANECNNDEVYNDANTMPESFVYKKLQTITVSAEAQAVLDKANELLKKSMKYRKLFNDEHPEVQILNADAGWYQIKQMLKEYMPDELKEFKIMYNKLAEVMRPRIYEFGFLRK